MNKEWFVFKGTHHLGPFSKEEMVEFFRSSEINGQALIWKEGNEKWEPLSKTPDFQFLFETPKAPIAKPAPIVLDVDNTFDDEDDGPPPLPPIPTLPKAAPQIHAELDDDMPPPIPLDAILDPKGHMRLRARNEDKNSRYSKYALIVGSFLFISIIGWYALTQKEAGIQLRIKGLMPVYLEKLEITATKNSPNFEAAMALSLDSLTLWGSTNFGGEIDTVIKLDSIPRRVLGVDDVSLTVKGKFLNHVGKFNRMILTKGSKFLPGEYSFHVEGREIHYLNRHFKSLNGISFFKKLNKTYSYDGSALIYPGTPREFEKRLLDYSTTLLSEKLKPYQDKLERVQTLESILNATSQNYLMELDKAKTGKDIASFETKFMKEISPLLQALVVKAHELSVDPLFTQEENSMTVIAPYKGQVQLGKQIGEMASDMITSTQKHKKLSDKDKAALRRTFEMRAKNIKLQINMNIRQIDEQIQKISL